MKRFQKFHVALALLGIGGLSLGIAVYLLKSSAQISLQEQNLREATPSRLSAAGQLSKVTGQPEASLPGAKSGRLPSAMTKISDPAPPTREQYENWQKQYRDYVVDHGMPPSRLPEFQTMQHLTRWGGQMAEAMGSEEKAVGLFEEFKECAMQPVERGKAQSEELHRVCVVQAKTLAKRHPALLAQWKDLAAIK